MSKTLLAVFVFGIVLFGCTQTVQTGEPPQNAAADNVQDNVSATDDNDGVFDNLGNGSELGAPFYEPFSIQRFEKAKAEGKIILLEFYANWCPICIAQKPALEEAFIELTDSRIVGFQVNYKDSETEASEIDLARKYGVTYQHTHVIVDAHGNVLLKELTQWDKETVKEKLAQAAAGT